MALLASLKHRPFLLLWLGRTTSQLGNGVYGITLDWWILQKTHSATATGVLLIIAFLPTVAFVLVGGVVADRFSRLRIMLAADLIRGVLMLLMTMLEVLNALPLWVVVIVTFLFGVTSAFFVPALSSVVPQLLPAPLLPSANSLRAISARVMTIIGPAIGAALIAVGGTALAFAINSGSFFISAGFILAILPHLRQVASTRSSNARQNGTTATFMRFGRDFREGLQTVIALPWVWITIALVSFANMPAEGAEDVTLPYLVQQTLHASPLLYGGLTATTALGTLGGAIWCGGRRLRHRGWLIYGYFIVAVLMLTLIGFVPHLPIILTAMLLYGCFSAILGLAWTNALQEYIPKEQLGRVSSLDQFGSTVFNPLSYGVIGVFTDWLGAPRVLIWGGMLSAGIMALGLLSRSVRRLD